MRTDAQRLDFALAGRDNEVETSLQTDFHDRGPLEVTDLALVGDFRRLYLHLVQKDCIDQVHQVEFVQLEDLKMTEISWRDNVTLETRAKMSAAHKARWALHRERYIKANRRGATKRKGKKYKMLKPSKSAVYTQYGVRYPSLKAAARRLGLHERLIRLVLEGKRKHTGGFQFELAPLRQRNDKERAEGFLEKVIQVAA